MNRNRGVRTPTPGRSSGKQERSHSREREFQILIEKWDFEMDVVYAGIMDTGREIAKNCFQCGSSEHCKKRYSVFKLRQANVEIASQLPHCNITVMGVTANENTEKTQALCMTFLIHGKMTKALVDSGRSVSLVS